MKRFLLAATACGALAAPSAWAATATTNLTVSATVIDTCVVSATALAFADLETSGPTTEVAPGEITVTCTADKTGLTVALGGGGNATGGQRRMDDGGGNFVPYDIHSDSGHSSEVAIGANIFSGNVTATVPQVIEVYGEVPAGSYASGNYGDTVLITVTY